MKSKKNWMHAARRLWPRLVDVGRKRMTLTYEEAAPGIDTNPLSVRFALGPIQDYCLDNRLPPLTAIVVGKNSGVPGTGFIAWDLDDLEVARDAIAAYNWSLLRNPFQAFDDNVRFLSHFRIWRLLLS